jgi:hypothetical protein
VQTRPCYVCSVEDRLIRQGGGSVGLESAAAILKHARSPSITGGSRHHGQHKGGFRKWVLQAQGQGSCERIPDGNKKVKQGPSNYWIIAWHEVMTQVARI